jgi:invasion protein IalB
MPTTERHAAPLLAGALLLILAGSAAAQQPAPRVPTPPARPAPAQHAQTPVAPAAPAAPPAQPAQAAQEPQRTTASFGDWVVRCETLAGPPLQKTCDMDQFAQVQGQANPISRVAIPLPAKGQPAKLIVQLPVNVSFAVGVRIAADSKDAGVIAPFRRCVPSGCLAEIDLKDDLLKKFRASPEAGKLQFKDAAERDVAIPLSFKGFGQAYDALLKQ